MTVGIPPTKGSTVSPAVLVGSNAASKVKTTASPRQAAPSAGSLESNNRGRSAFAMGSADWLTTDVGVALAMGAGVSVGVCVAASATGVDAAADTGVASWAGVGVSVAACLGEMERETTTS